MCAQAQGHSTREEARKERVTMLVFSVMAVVGFTVAGLVRYMELYPNSQLAHYRARAMCTVEAKLLEDQIKEIEESLRAVVDHHGLWSYERERIQERIEELRPKLTANPARESELARLIMQRDRLDRERQELEPLLDRLNKLRDAKQDRLSEVRAKRARHVEALLSGQ